MSAADEVSGGVASGDVRVIALMGNPNTGKTTLFNRISGLRHKTSNFAGTTLEARVTRVKAGVEGGRDGDLIDLPGVYSLELDQLESRVSREVLAGQSAPSGVPLRSPECVVVVVDATNLARNLTLVGEVLRRRLPTVVVVNMMDLAEKAGVRVDLPTLQEQIGCEVVGACARTGEGIDEIRVAIRRARVAVPRHAVPGSVAELRHWAEDVYQHAIPGAGGEFGNDGEKPPPDNLQETLSDRADRVLLHPVLGAACFAAVMGGLFYTIFSLAQYPMGWIEGLFERGAGLVQRVVPDGPVQELLTGGIVNGVGSTLVFLPQICLLFFLISLLEDTGYLARGAFLMDRLLRPFGLPGHAFVPLLSSHACALPGIMATRGIPDHKERLATILVAPFMSCSARLPVYILLTSVLFAQRPSMAALAFVGCYALGIGAGVLSAMIARRTLLKGASRPMAMELPSYKWPSLRTAGITTVDRAWTFVKKAGTNILMICIALWWLGEYPKVSPPAQAVEMRAQAQGMAEESSAREQLVSAAERLEASHAKAHSFLGRIGGAAQPLFEPMGLDRQLTIGVLASFAAREVFVSTMSVVIAGTEDAEDQGIFDQLSTARRDDNSALVFNRATCWSLLVFFVLAMQCLPTLAVTARESGGWKWALVQLVWMSLLAYVSATIVYQALNG